MKDNMNNKPPFDVYKIRKDFPCLQQIINDQQLVFLDSASSAQKPQVMLDSLQRTYSTEYANIHRGNYYLSELATEKFETTRHKVAKLINAQSAAEIIFTKGTTESINLIAESYGGLILKAEDEVLISELEHHANIVPWQQICKRTGAKLCVVKITDDGELDMNHFDKMLSNKTKIVAMLHVSNAIGTILPIKTIIDKAHACGAKVMIDAAQSIVHYDIDVQELDVDFLVFSAHKLYGPNGVGILYGKQELLDIMPPYQTGGAMVNEVTFEKTTFQPIPLRFEAGTPAIAEVIAFGETIDYLSTIDRKTALKHEQSLLHYATKEMMNIPTYTIIGNVYNKCSIISFVHNIAHSSDIGFILDKRGIAIRTGHHCTQPLMKRFGITSTARMSLAMYTTREDIDAFLNGLHAVNKLF